jgi:hypothetical protein
MRLACCIVALICFVLSVIPPTAGAFNWTGLGLAFLTLSLCMPV